MPKLHLLILSAGLTLVAACGPVQRSDVGPKERIDPVLSTWLLPACPSLEPDKARAPGGVQLQNVIPMLLGGIAVSAANGIIDWVGSALDEAAKLDREGYAMSAVSPSYLWIQQSGERKLAGCIVVALSSTPPAQWCKSADSPFATQPELELHSLRRLTLDTGKPGFKMRPICNTLEERLEAQAALKPPTWDASSKAWPKFYAEIELEPSSDDRGVLPRLRALYYPGDVSPKFKRGAASRTLQVSVSAATPDGTKALTTSVVKLEDLTPSLKIRFESTAGEHALPKAALPPWAAPMAIPEKYVAPKNDGPIFPVNVTTEIRELRPENPALQAFAAVFGKQKDMLKAQAKTEIDQLVSPQSQDDLRKAYDALAADVYAAEAAVRTACKPAGGAPMNPSAVMSALLKLVAAHDKLEAASAPTSGTLTFSPDGAAVRALRMTTAVDVCKAFP